MTDTGIADDQPSFWPEGELVSTLRVEIPELKPESNKLIHYCSLDAFYAIIGSGRLRFTSAKSTNDPSEFVFGQEVVSQAIDKAFKEHGSGPYNLLKGCREKFMKRDFRAFVFCMSEAVGSEEEIGELSQWRLYGADGRGVGLVFDTASTKDHDALMAAGSLPRRVVYGASEGAEVAKRQIERYLNKIGSASADLKSYLDATPGNAQGFLINWLFWLPSVIKHEAYQHEREVRLIRGDVGDAAGNPLVFFERGGIQRPAIERQIGELVGKPPDQRIESPLKGVIIGPSSDQPALVDSIKYYSQANRWDLSVARSDIPYRALS